MENLNMIKPQGVQNIINKFCYTIGMIPTSYKISLTYEEQILAIGNYLESVVYPAINNNAEALVELQGLFAELKNYVDNYFDNLDVQDEINNKLDAMAESGELTDIITAYLQLACIYGFNTIADMEEATNLIDGSFMRTYGQDTLYDGLGAFYKAREILNTDVIDGVNIVALSDPNLVAQKIFDTEFLTLKVNTETAFDIINSNDTILIGDSYGQGYTYNDGSASYVDGWCANLQSILGLDNSECFTFAEGGLGFADPGQGGHTGFLDLLQDNASTITNKNRIKNIIVCGGHNDSNQSFSAIDYAIGQFIAYCKTTFPNAKVYIGMIANDGRTDATGITKRQAIKNVLIAYQKCRAYDGIYLNGVENVMKYYPNFSDDKYHPTATGYTILAQNIAQAFHNGYTTYDLTESTVTLEDETNINWGTVSIKSQLLGNITQFKITSGTITFTNPISITNGYMVLGDVICNNFKFTEYGTLEIPVYVGITTADNKYYGNMGYMSINNQNQLLFSMRYFKNDGSSMSNLSNVKSIFLDTGYGVVSTFNC